MAAIQAYQRHLSPRKGYGCAYRLAHGGSGCSGVGLRLVRRHGVVDGLALLRRRLHKCGEAHAAQRARHAAYRRARLSQRGDCDPGCDVLDCCDLPCDAALPQSWKQWMRDHPVWTLLLALAGAALVEALYRWWTLP